MKLGMNIIEKNTRRAGTLTITDLCAVLMFMHLAAPQFEQSAVSC